MAIAFDAHAVGSLDSSWSHTCTGSDRMLAVMIFGNMGGGSSLISGITYNSVAMTNGGSVLCSADRWLEAWYLMNPSTGANTIVVSSTADHYRGGSLSFTGVSAFDQAGTNATGGGAGTSSDVTLTVPSGALIIGAGRENTGFAGNWTLITEDATASPSGSGLHSAYGYPYSGSQTAGFSNQPFSQSAAVIVSFTAVGGGGGATPSRNLTLLGIG